MANDVNKFRHAASSTVAQGNTYGMMIKPNKKLSYRRDSA